MSEIFRIIYCSRNVLDRPESPAELEQILAVSRRNNAAQGVTGALLYTDGMFAQTLEGRFEDVQDVFERIQGDPRHDDVVVLQAETVKERIFGEWAMANAEPDDPEHARDVLSAALATRDRGQFETVLGLLGRVLRCERA